jgi:aminopeptidase N
LLKSATKQVVQWCGIYRHVWLDITEKIYVANWYPVVCVYDDEGWNLDPYYPIGDPFYSDTANYRVDITVPQEYKIAATGQVVEEVAQEAEKSISVDAKAVRDFAWIASDKFQVSKEKVGDTIVYSYHYTPEGGVEALDYAASALEIFNNLFGKYPYSQLSVVQSDFFIGGMEYPNLVMIDGTLYSDGNLNWLEIITVHEVAHQWWYGLVGNDQVDEPWLDESLTEYSTVLYYGQRYGAEEEQRKYEELISKGKYQLFQIYTADHDIDETIDRPIHKFDNWIVYDSLVYGKGAIMFYELRKEMGDDTFFEVLREYFNSNQFKNASPKDLMDACKKVTGKEWNSFFDKWLYD